MVAEILQFEVGNLYCTETDYYYDCMMMKLGNAVVDIAVSSQT